MNSGTDAIDDMKAELVAGLAAELAQDGLKIMTQGDGRLAQEILECVNSLLDNRPQFVLDSPDRDKSTMLAGVTLGLAFQKNNELVEKAGGFDGLESTFLEDGLSAMIQKINDARGDKSA